MLIEVTQEDIDAGKREDCRNCPIALAVKRACPNWLNIAVSWQVEADTINGDPIEIQLPQEAEDFVGMFDDGMKVQPFTFTLDL
jgi:hypothetical protein